MSDDEAKGILNAEFLKLRAAGYSDLAELVERKVQSEVTGRSGNVYHVELEAFWEDGIITPTCVSSPRSTMAACAYSYRSPTRSRSALPA